MTNYTLAIGTHDPRGLQASTEGDAIKNAVSYIVSHLAEELRRNPQEVVTLLGPGGLVTRPGERIDEFVRRLGENHAAGPADTFLPGDANTPDCNGD